MSDTDTQMYASMPAQVAPVQLGSYVSEGIASMRWESDQLIISLRIRLGGYTPMANKDGQTQLVRMQGMIPMVNDLGIDRFCALIQGVVNPVSGLSNIDDQEANTLINQVLKGLIAEIVYNQKRFEIHSGDMKNIMSILKVLVFMQLKRAVSGHESKNFRTQTVEQNVQQSLQNQSQQSSGMNPFLWGSKKQ